MNRVTARFRFCHLCRQSGQSAVQYVLFLFQIFDVRAPTCQGIRRLRTAGGYRFVLEGFSNRFLLQYQSPRYKELVRKCSCRWHIAEPSTRFH